MKFTIPLLLLCLLFTLPTSAQSPYTVKGAVIDSSLNQRLMNTTVCVLNAKDSTLRSFARANANGDFAISKLGKGKFILLISYPGYADYVENFTLDSLKNQRDFGKVYLTLKSKLLADVIIKGTVAAIKIKGDTTEFNAKAYTIQPNSKVEDLLKQLPGIQVDKDGKITAQGQTVSKVLVDGEEFFGDDPTLVTKNIRGDMVDKVQLYDKKSDQAAFTGIDDGQKTKTINIKLKEDKKNGYFGKLDGAIGTDKYYQEQAMYNQFAGKKKFAAYGIAANTGKVGLGWEDSNKYGTSSTEVTDDGIIFFGGGSGDLDSFDGRYDGQGIPIANTGGLHYDNKWDTDKKSINTNYKIGSLDVDGSRNSQVQNNLPAGIINSNSDQNFKNSMFRQKLDVMYQVKLDTASNLKLTADGTLKNSKNTNNYVSSTTNGANALLNHNTRSLTNDVDSRIFNASAFYTHKFKKVGRTISANVSGNVNSSDAKGYLNSETDFYNKTTALLDSMQNTNQYKVTTTSSSSVNSNFTYTEPITKKLSLSASYGLAYNNSNQDRQSFNQTAPGSGIYTVLDTKFSNDYTVDQLSNSLGATLNYRTTKATLNISNRTSDVNFKQIDENTGTPYTRSFINWYPNASYQYRFTQQKSLRISYYGNTTQPNIDQIQPIRVNTDPLNITLGNPDLKPSYRNQFSFNYNSYKVLSDQSVYMYGSFSFTDRAIVSNTVTDSTGKSTYQSINLAGHQPFNYAINASYGQKVTKLGITVRVFVAGNGNRSYNYANSVLNITNTNSYSGQLSISKYKQKKYDFSLGAGPGYTLSGSSLQKNINNNGYTFNGYAYFTVYLPGKVQIAGDGNYNYRGKTQSFNETFSKFIVNTVVSKTFLKQDNLKLSLSGNDILNQNRGFDRSSNNGTINQNTYTTIKRFFLFSITWDFNKMGGAPQPQK
jgi:hypothetical protein